LVGDSLAQQSANAETGSSVDVVRVSCFDHEHQVADWTLVRFQLRMRVADEESQSDQPLLVQCNSFGQRLDFVQSDCMAETLEAPAGRSVSLAQGGATEAHAKVLGTHEATVLL
jgi:hypothetical protein